MAVSATPAFSCHLVAVFISWFILNITLNYYNARVLSHTNFHFPFLLTLANKSVGFLVAVTLMSFRSGLPNPSELGAQFLRPIVHLQGVATALNIGLNNWSLVFISLTMNQILKSTVPLPTATLSLIFEKKSFSWQLWGSMTVLVGGCVTAAWGSLGAEPVMGILICLGSILSAATWTVSSAIIMQMGEKPLDAVSLLFVSGPTCIFTLLGFFCGLELPLLLNASMNDTPPVHMVRAGPWKPVAAFLLRSSVSLTLLCRVPCAAPQMFAYVGIGTLLASTYDIVHNQFVKMTSSVNMAIMGNSKLALLIVLSMATLESPPTPMRIAGVFVAFAGVLWYAWFSLQPKPKAPVADDKTGTQADEKTQPLKPSEATVLLKKDDDQNSKGFLGGLFGGAKEVPADKA